MLLVDDDEGEVGEGQEERGSGADDEAGVAGGDGHPGAAAGGLGDAGVPLGGAGAEAGLDAVEELDGEGDLGEEDEGLAAAGERLGDGLEIDLGLAGAGDALQERGGVAAGGDGGAEGGGGLGLGGRQRARAGGGVEGGIRGVARGFLAEEHALGFEALDDRGRDAGELGDLGRREAEVAVLGEGGQHPGAGLGHAVGLGSGAAQDRARGGRRAEAGGAGGEAEHAGERGQGVLGGAGEEGPHRRAERRRVEDAGDVAELGVVEAPLPRPPDDAEHPTRPEGHLHEVAGPRAAGRRAVVEEAVQAVGGDHGDGLALREEPRGIGRIEVFHRAIPWAIMPRHHKG